MIEERTVAHAVLRGLTSAGIHVTMTGYDPDKLSLVASSDGASYDVFVTKRNATLRPIGERVAFVSEGCEA